MLKVQPSLRARENSPVHRRDAPLRRHTKLIRTVNRQREQQCGGVVPRDPVPDTHSTSSRVSARTDSIIVSQIRPSHRARPRASGASSHPWGWVYNGVPHQSLSTPESRKFIVSGARSACSRGWRDTRGTSRWIVSRRRSRRNAVIDRARRGRLWSPRGIGILTL